MRVEVRGCWIFEQRTQEISLKNKERFALGQYMSCHCISLNSGRKSMAYVIRLAYAIHLLLTRHYHACEI